ncbi:uncharacterized protein LOC130498805 [Raphanus sativus]|uniref:Uncharacterized protein LOC130498805 n=1 Tax=Raphanus sativus TaxID=3726 RepID=A0A9W3CAA9_RAPSA|nr:uncharacterized protein LOC130498805 [Raphanus sativus]
MTKWSAVIVVIMMVVTVMVITTEAENAWIKCFRKCSKPCKPNDGNCYLRCKVKCGGPNPPHGPGGPPHHSFRRSHGMTSVEFRGKKE